MMVLKIMYYLMQCNTKIITLWKSEGLFDEIIKNPSTPGKRLAPSSGYICNKTKVKIDGSYFKQDKIKFTRGTIVNI